MKVVVIGGSGATGRYLIRELLASEKVTMVTALLRRPFFDSHPKLNQIIVDFDRQGELDIQGDIAFSCLGTTLEAAGSKEKQWKVDYDYQYSFAQLASKGRIPTFVLVSAYGSNKNSAIFYSSMKGKLEEAVIQLDFEHTYIFQPGMLDRPDTDRKYEKLFVRLTNGIAKLGLFKNYRATHVADLAHAMIVCAMTRKDKRKRILTPEIHELARQKG